MRRDAEAHADDDKKRREEVETRNEADNAVYRSEKMLKDSADKISGDDKGKRARVLRVHPKSGRVTVEGVNVVKRHRKASQTTEAGIVEFPAPIHHSKVMLIDPKTGTPSRVRRRVDTDGTVERIAVKSGEPIPRSR